MIKINNMVVNQDKFPDGTLHLDLSKTSGFIAERNTLYWFYENDSELFTIICIKRFFEDNYSKNFPLYLEMRYLPHARFDRAPNYGDVFTLKYFYNYKKSAMLMYYYIIYLFHPVIHFKDSFMLHLSIVQLF